MILAESIFYFPDQPALQCQSEETCRHLYEHLISTLLDLDPTRYGDLIKILSYVKDQYNIVWVPRYACAILSSAISVDTAFLRMVGLDGWKSRIHSCVHGREKTAEADVLRPAEEDIGHHSQELLSDLMARCC